MIEMDFSAMYELRAFVGRRRTSFAKPVTSTESNTVLYLNGGLWKKTLHSIAVLSGQH